MRKSKEMKNLMKNVRDILNREEIEYDEVTQVYQNADAEILVDIWDEKRITLKISFLPYRVTIEKIEESFKEAVIKSMNYIEDSNLGY